MGFVDRMVAPLQRAGEPRGTHTLSGLNQIFGRNDSGQHVTVRTAMALTPVWAAVWLIAELGSSLPIRVYTNRLDTLTPAPNAWQQRLMRQPNREMGDGLFLQTLLAHIELWGEAFVGKEKILGRVVGLWPMDPERMTVERVNGQKRFHYTEDDGTRNTYTSSDVIHVVGKTLDGVTGISTIGWFRSTLGRAQALDSYGSGVLRDRGVPLGVLSVKGRITKPEHRDEMRDEWADRFKGKPGNIAILDDGAQFSPVSIPLADAQYIEQREMTVNDIARMFGVWPESIGGKTANPMTYTNLEARNTDLYKFVLKRRLKRIEDAFFGDPDLFPNQGRQEPRFWNVEFLRGDLAGTLDALNTATAGRQILTQDEAREHLGEGPKGGAAAELSQEISKTPVVPTGNTPGTPPTDTTGA